MWLFNHLAAEFIYITTSAECAGPTAVKELDNSTGLFKSLHWLKVEQRIQYKIISITHNLLHIAEPKYLHRLINIKLPSRTRSSDHLCLSLPPDSTRLKFADRSPSNSSPRIWNSLPINMRSFASDTHHSTTVMSSTPSHPCRALSRSHNQSSYRWKNCDHRWRFSWLNHPLELISAVNHSDM